MNVTVFSTTTCATCHLVTGWLDKQGVAYDKKNTDDNAGNMAEFMEVCDGSIGVPFTVITDDAGTETKIMGFDQGRFRHALSLS
jgi:glutaredoxin